MAAHSENINANKAETWESTSWIGKSRKCTRKLTHNRDELLAPYRNAVVAAQKAYDAEVAKVRNEAIAHLQEVSIQLLKRR